MNTHADKAQENKSQSISATSPHIQRRSESAFQFVDKRPEAIAQRKLQEMVNSSTQVSQLKAFQDMANKTPKVKQTAQFQPLEDNYSAQDHKHIQKKNTSVSIDPHVSRSEGSGTSSPVQMVKIKVDGVELETNGQSYEDLESLRNRVSMEDSIKLELAIKTAHAMRSESTPSISRNFHSNSGLRKRGASSATPMPAPENPVTAAPHSFATSQGPASHGPTAWISTGGSIVTGAPDLAALRNSSADTMSMTGRTVRDVRKGNFRDAAISATQGLLSAGQVALSTPAAHVLNHAAGAAVGLPLPLPAADALWYPANSAKNTLEEYRDPKEKTE